MKRKIFPLIVITKMTLSFSIAFGQCTIPSVVNAYSTAMTGCNASYANDGNTSTGWRPNTTNPTEYITFDLGASNTKIVTKIVFNFSISPYSLSVYGSNNATTGFTLILNSIDFNCCATTSSATVNVNTSSLYRYIRVGNFIYTHDGGTVGGNCNCATPVYLMEITISGYGSMALGDICNTVTLNTYNKLKVQTNQGYIDMGAQDADWANINTDRPGFLTNKDIYSTTGGFGAKGGDDVSATNPGQLFFKVNDETRMTILNDGTVGIGTTVPSYRLQVVETTNGWTSKIENNGCAVYSAYGSGASDGYGMHIRVNNTRSERYALQIYNGTNFLLHVRNDGNVGIGTLNPTAKLTVNGTIKAERVDVIADVPAADYVFEKSYNLRKLEDVEDFILTNKHLPEVPSASEFKDKGYSLGQMDGLLLRKVEELTLYTIELNKKLVAQEKVIQELQQKIPR